MAGAVEAGAGAQWGSGRETDGSSAGRWVLVKRFAVYWRAEPLALWDSMLAGIRSVALRWDLLGACVEAPSALSRSAEIDGSEQREDLSSTGGDSGACVRVNEVDAA